MWFRKPPVQPSIFSFRAAPCLALAKKEIMEIRRMSLCVLWVRKLGYGRGLGLNQWSRICAFFKGVDYVGLCWFEYHVRWQHQWTLVVSGEECA